MINILRATIKIAIVITINIFILVIIIIVSSKFSKDLLLIKHYRIKHYLIPSSLIFTIVILPKSSRRKLLFAKKVCVVDKKNSTVGRIRVCNTAVIKFVWRAHYSLCLAQIKLHVYFLEEP